MQGSPWGRGLSHCSSQEQGNWRGWDSSNPRQPGTALGDTDLAGTRLGHSPECGQDVHGPWQGQAGLWVLGIGPAVASVEHGLNVPAADMGPWALDGMGQAGTTSPRDALRAWATLLKFS